MRALAFVIMALGGAAGLAAAQDGLVPFGNLQGCATVLGHQTSEATNLAILEAGELRFYEIACKVLSVGKRGGRPDTLTARCVDYDEPYEFTWNFRANGQGGFVLSTPDNSYSTVLRACR